jgi:IS5 family transposase
MIRMRPKERRDGGQKDLFRARLDQIVDMNHPRAKLAAAIDWGFLENSFGAMYTDRHPPLPTRLMAGIAILKHMHNLSDEGLCERWLEIHIISCSVVRNSSSTSCRSIAPR